MRKAICLTLVGMMFSATGFAQTVIANQQQQVINVNVPTIEKTVYVDRYKTVYVEKPRPARKLSAPVKLLGYLWVYPEDIGDFKQVPVDVINSVNSQSPYGRNNWRIPTPDELSILIANADQIGLSSEIYLATDHRNGILRLVSTGPSGDDIVSSGQGRKIGNTIWSTQIFTDGPNSQFSSSPRAISKLKFPKGWRLPTSNEVAALVRYNNNDPVRTWQFLKNLTSTNLEVEEYTNSINGSAIYEKNEGYLIYMGNEGPTKVGFCLGTDRRKPEISYGEDCRPYICYYGYIILVYDGM